MNSSLVVFLQARLDEEESAARAVLWEGSGNDPSWDLPASATVAVGEDMFYVNDREVANHIVRHDPARVLAQVEAKRKAVDACAYFLNDSEDGPDPCASTVLAALAQPYREHPDYPSEQAPDPE